MACHGAAVGAQPSREVVGTAGVYIEDVPLTAPFVGMSSSDLSPFDLERIGVLKGPPEALYGSYFLGGTLLPGEVFLTSHVGAETTESGLFTDSELAIGAGRWVELGARLQDQAHPEQQAHPPKTRTSKGSTAHGSGDMAPWHRRDQPKGCRVFTKFLALRRASWTDALKVTFGT